MGAPGTTTAEKPAYADLIDKSRPWWKNSRIWLLNFWISLLLLTSSANGYDGSMMNGLQSLSQWNVAFNNPGGAMLGLLNAIQNIGSVAGLPLTPYMADGMGRRFSVIFGASIVIVATALQTASQSVNMFIGARFLVGFGLTFATNSAPLLVTEVAYPTQRAPVTSLYNTMYFLGSIVAAWTTFGTFHIPSSWAWRVPSLMQGIPSVLQVLLLWFVPESPRWLVSKGREEEALNILAYYHANGNRHDPLVEYEFEEIKAAIAFDREVAANVGWISFIRTPGNRRRLRVMIAIGVFSQWSGNGLTSYYLNKVFDDIGITNPTIQLLFNGCLSIWSLILGVSGSLLCDKAGRRVIFLTSTIGMLVFWTLQTICFSLAVQNNNLSAGHAVVAMIFLFQGFYGCAFVPLIVSYTLEILPFPLRAKGYTFFSFVVYLSLVFNQYVNPIALAALGWKYYLVYLFWLCFEVIFVYFFVVETKNRTLEETAAMFDGDANVAQISEKAVATAGIITQGDQTVDDGPKVQIEHQP